VLGDGKTSDFYVNSTSNVRTVDEVVSANGEKTNGAFIIYPIIQKSITITTERKTREDGGKYVLDTLGGKYDAVMTSSGFLQLSNVSSVYAPNGTIVVSNTIGYDSTRNDRGVYANKCR